MAKTPAVKPPTIRQRIVRTALYTARELKQHPLNFRQHGADQRRDVAAMFETIGQVAPLIGRDMPDGTVQLLDGHLRQDIADDKQILVAVTDLNDQEASVVLAMLDYTSSQAVIDTDLAAALASQAKGSGLLPDDIWNAWDVATFADADKAAFAPNLAPTSASGSVTADDVAKAGGQLAGQFSGSTGPKIVEVTCPHCGKQFGMDARV